MKKIILTLIAILIGTYVALSLVSSGNEYAAEKQFFKATKAYDKIKVNPDVAPPKLIASVEKDLESLTKKYPETNTAKGAHIALAEIYIQNKKYEEAIKTLDNFISASDKTMPLLANAYFLKGAAYEQQGKWDKALKEFNTLKEKYINTPIGLQIPVYIAQHYKKAGNIALADQEFTNAISFYEKIERDNRSSMLGYASASLIIQCYMNMDKYERAGEAVRSIIINYPSGVTLVQQLPLVEYIYIKTLKQPEKAIEIYKYILGKTEDEQLKKYLELKIKEAGKK